jgi:hypothetical protein
MNDEPRTTSRERRSTSSADGDDESIPLDALQSSSTRGGVRARDRSLDAWRARMGGEQRRFSKFVDEERDRRSCGD